MTMTTGEQLKADGIATVLSRDAEWKDLVLWVIRRLAQDPRGRSFTVEHVRSVAVAFAIPEPPHRNGWGAVMNAAAKTKLIRKLGYVNASRETAHARMVAVWAGSAQQTAPTRYLEEVRNAMDSEDDAAAHEEGDGGGADTSRHHRQQDPGRDGG